MSFKKLSKITSISLLSVFIIIAIILLYWFTSILTAKSPSIDTVTPVLLERLQKRGVPVISIEAINKTPLDIKVNLQSNSDSDVLLPEDGLNISWINHEVHLVHAWGENISNYSIETRNSKGVLISEFMFAVLEDKKTLSARKETILDDGKAFSTITDQLNLGSLSLQSVDISSSQQDDYTGQIAVISISVLDSYITSQTITEYLPVIFDKIENINAVENDSVHLSICLLQFFDKDGNILVSNAVDLQSNIAIRSIYKPFTGEEALPTVVPYPIP
jgi:hypothetical protein